MAARRYAFSVKKKSANASKKNSGGKSKRYGRGNADVMYGIGLGAGMHKAGMFDQLNAYLNGFNGNSVQRGIDSANSRANPKKFF